MGQEELAQGSGGQAAFDIGIVKIGAGEISELLGGIFTLRPGEVWGLGNRLGSAMGALIVAKMVVRRLNVARMILAKIVGAVPSQEVENFDRVNEGERGLVFQIFMRHVEQFLEIGIAESGTRGI